LRPKQGSRPREEEGRGKEGREKEKKKRKKENERKGNRKKENKKRKIEKGFGNLGEILRKLGERGEEGFLRIFPGFSDTGVNSGMAVMARRTDRRDRGVRGIPDAVGDNGAGTAGGGRRPECRRCRQNSRHARRG
jgi:hypothetical protein